MTGYPAFLIMDNESARPRNVRPFRKDGNNLTPQQFARACEDATTFLPMPTKETPNESREALENKQSCRDECDAANAECANRRSPPWSCSRCAQS